MKAIMKLVFVLIMTLNYAQNNEKKENIKIGDYKYEIFLQDGWNYERNLNYINFILKFRHEEQFLGNYLTYRKTSSSQNYKNKISEELPLDIRSTYKDGIILSEGEIEINEAKKTITAISKTFYKDKGFESDPDTIKRIYRQKRCGSFELVQVSEFGNNKETITYKK